MTKALALLFMAIPIFVWGKPHGFSIHKGSASISEQNGKTQIITHGDKTILHWQGFSVAKGEKVRFQQPHTDAFVLNRVQGGEVSKILGKIKSNGNVFLINPNGVVIGCDARIQAAGFIASTADLSDQAFLSGDHWLFAQPSTGEIIHQGEIECPEGAIYLIGKKVTNEGSLKGHVIGVFADQEVLICPKENQRVLIAPKEKSVSRLKETLEGDNPYELAINQKGMIQATSFKEEGGKIYLVSAEGKVHVEGSVQAQGGEIRAWGDRIDLGNEASLDVSGNVGGKILIGGDFRGQNPDVPHAQHVHVSKGVNVRADGLQGDGGEIIVWADDTTHFYGEASAKAIGQEGNGGFIEISGVRHLLVQGHPDVRAQNGKSGTVLFDPGPVNVNSGDSSGPNTFGDDYIINQLGLGDFTITTAAASGTGNELITVEGEADITWASNHTLTFSAGEQIEIQSGAQVKCTGGGGITLEANIAGSDYTGNGIRIEGATLSTTTGDISLSAIGGNHDTNKGIVLIDGMEISTKTGGIHIQGTSRAANGNSPGSGIGVLLSDNNATIQTEDGPITITGQGGGGGLDAYGIRLQNGSLIQSTGSTKNGSITLTGTGTSVVYSGQDIEGDGINFGGLDGDGNLPTITSVNGDISLTGYGHGSYRSEGISITEQGLIQSTGTGANAAKISLEGTGSPQASAIGSPGISLSGATISITSIDGDITLSGTASGSGGRSNNGVEINGAKVSSIGTGNYAGNIKIMGQSSLCSSGNPAVKLAHGGLSTQVPAAVTTVNGNIDISGIAEGTTADENQGISVKNGSKIAISGSGNMTLSGIGGGKNAGSTDCQGILVSDANSTIQTATGTLTINEAKGGGPGSGNNGISVVSAGVISTSSGALKVTQATAGSGPSVCEGILVDGANSAISSTSGSIDLTGLGGSNGDQNRGIHVTNSGTIASSGPITLNGIGGGVTDSNQGILIEGGGTVKTEGGGALSLIGTGGSSGTTNNHGIEIDGTGVSLVSTKNGALSLTATGGGNGIGNHGIFLHSGAEAEVTGSGTMTLEGTGSSGGTGSCVGIYVTDANSKMTTSGGSLTINKATGGGLGSSNHGLSVVAAGQISTTNGILKVAQATGGNGSDTCEGILVDGANSAISSTSGSIDLTGYGGSNGKENRGIHVTNSGSVTSSGPITLNGTGGGTSDHNQGILVDAGGKVKTQESGTLALSGSGGSSGTTNNHGIEIDGTGASLVSTENGALSLTATGGGNGIGNHGIFLHSGGSAKATGTGTVNLSGTGSASGTGSCIGVYLTGSGTTASTTSGNNTMHGTGKGTGGGCQGIAILNSAKVAATGGSLTLTGIGGGNGDSNQGILIGSGGSTLTSGAGNITILNGTKGGSGTTNNHGIEVSGGFVSLENGALSMTAQGGGTGGSDRGIYVHQAGIINATGTGKITLSGTGANGVDECQGVLITDAQSKISSTSGELSITAHGSGSGDQNHGLSVVDGGQVSTTSGLLKVIQATAGSGSGVCEGILVDGENSKISSSTGNVQLSGTGGANGGQNRGIHVTHGATVTSSGALTLTGLGNGTADSNQGILVDAGGTLQTQAHGAMTLNGTGGVGTTKNDGIVCEGSGSQISTFNGLLKVTGITRGTGAANHGVFLNSGGDIVSKGTGIIHINGTGGAVAPDSFGVKIAQGSSIQSKDGFVQIKGQSTGIAKEAILIDDNGFVSSTSTANVKLVSFGDIKIQNGGYIASEDSGKILLESSRDISIVGGEGAQKPAFISPTHGVAKIVAGRDLNLIGGSGDRSEAQIGHHSNLSTSPTAKLEFIIGRDVNLRGENTNSFAIIGHGDPANLTQQLAGTINLFQVFRDVNLYGANQGEGEFGFARIGHVDQAGGNIYVSALRDVNLIGGAAAESAYTRIGHGKHQGKNLIDPVKLTVIAGRSTDIHSGVGSSEIVNHNGSLTLVVDELYFLSPAIGPGEFHFHSLLQSTGELKIYTARRSQCFVNDAINGATFEPGPYGIDSPTEQWGVYYPQGNYSGTPFCFYYKEPDVIPPPPPPAPRFPVKGFLRNISADLTALPDILPLITDDPFAGVAVKGKSVLPQNPHD